MNLLKTSRSLHIRKITLQCALQPFSAHFKQNKGKNNLKGKGHYYEFHNVKIQKEHRKNCNQSLHRKSPLK